MWRFAKSSTSTCSTPSSFTASLIDPIATSPDDENGTPRDTLSSSSRDTKPNAISPMELGTSKCHSSDTPTSRPLTPKRPHAANVGLQAGPGLPGLGHSKRRVELVGYREERFAEVFGVERSFPEPLERQCDLPRGVGHTMFRLGIHGVIAATQSVHCGFRRSRAVHCPLSSIKDGFVRRRATPDRASAIHKGCES
jgi:hypothetical protein